jgi:hypothetical protein
LINNQWKVSIIHVGFGMVHPSLIGPISVTISLWCDHTSLIDSAVPIPAPLGSPAGPNQWFYGAPVVLALKPAYVVPFTVLERILSINC